METVAFIPVRGGSKSIPLKNIREIGGRPLVHWVMSAAIGCEGIDKVYVASDSAEIRDVASQIEHPKLVVVDRDKKNATDTASSESAILEFAEKYTFDRLVFIQATSPLLTAEDLNAALKRFSSGGLDSMVSVVREHRFLWNEKQNHIAEAKNYDPKARPRRQDWSGEIIENGAFYITTRNALMQSRCRISGKIGYFEMPKQSSIEIDDPVDFDIVSEMLKRTRFNDLLNRRCRKIKLFATDVDGVLTDSGVYVSAEGELCKKFNVRDGMGFGILHRAGIQTAIVTSEDSQIIIKRAKKLNIENVVLGSVNKLDDLRALSNRLNISLDEVAFIGDDINDFETLKNVGLAACPADAILANREIAHYVCNAKGGKGCVREFVDLILEKGQGASPCEPS